MQGIFVLVLYYYWQHMIFIVSLYDPKNPTYERICQTNFGLSLLRACPMSISSYALPVDTKLSEILASQSEFVIGMPNPYV